MLEAIRFYDISAILQNVHVVLDNKTGYYMNNYANWDTYNIVYDKIFLTDEVKKAKQYQRFCLVRWTLMENISEVASIWSSYHVSEKVY